LKGERYSDGGEPSRYWNVGRAASRAGCGGLRFAKLPNNRSLVRIASQKITEVAVDKNLAYAETSVVVSERENSKVFTINAVVPTKADAGDVMAYDCRVPAAKSRQNFLTGRCYFDTRSPKRHERYLVSERFFGVLLHR
jgi:hypothetical protein